MHFCTHTNVFPTQSEHISQVKQKAFGLKRTTQSEHISQLKQKAFGVDAKEDVFPTQSAHISHEEANMFQPCVKTF